MNDHPKVGRCTAASRVLLPADMTLRDFFASQVLSGLAAHPDGTVRGSAEYAYTMADEMLAVREIDPEDWADRP